MSSKFRILSLDGGGIKGAFTAAVLAAWEQELDGTGKTVADHFDMICGTSTGGILAIGLGLGLSPTKMLDFYHNSGPQIFPVTTFGKRWKHRLRHLFRPKFAQDVLREHLGRAYRDENGREPLFGDSTKRLVIPAYDALMGRIFLFKTAHHERFKYDIDAPAADVAVATAAAPTYFSAAPFPAHPGSSYVDGGMWANCPALAGVVEAVHVLNVPLENIRVLSIGTTYEPSTVRKLTKSGLFRWAPNIAELLMTAQAEAAHKQAMLLVGGPKNFLRVNFMTRPGDYKLDSAQDVAALAALGRAEAVKKEVLEKVKHEFLNGIAAKPFVPLA